MAFHVQWETAAAYTKETLKESGIDGTAKVVMGHHLVWNKDKLDLQDLAIKRWVERFNMDELARLFDCGPALDSTHHFSYLRHRPERSQIYQVIETYWPIVLKQQIKTDKAVPIKIFCKVRKLSFSTVAGIR